MAKGGHGLPKVSAPHDQPFYTLRAGGQRPSSTPLVTPRRTPMSVSDSWNGNRNGVEDFRGSEKEEGKPSVDLRI
jgi:hypothetical protein